MHHMTGHTPTAWKESHTILIHKKGDEQEIIHWRPIALTNTLYKLWTGFITPRLSKHAEHYALLSSSQEGFRADKRDVWHAHNGLCNWHDDNGRTLLLQLKV